MCTYGTISIQITKFEFHQNKLRAISLNLMLAKCSSVYMYMYLYVCMCPSSCSRPATGERAGTDEQHIYDTAGGSERQGVEEAIYEEFPEEKLAKLKGKKTAAAAVDSGYPPAAGSLYEAIYDYEGQAEGDLTFKTGDVIEVRCC